MNAQLQSIADDFASALRRLQSLETSAPDNVWHRRTGADGWSPAECVAHLNLTSEAFLPILRAGIADAARLGSREARRYRRDLWGILIGYASGTSRFKVKTTAAFVPSGVRAVGEMVAEFERLHDAQLSLVREADGLPIDRVKIASPFDARLRYSVYSALRILPAHQHRHLLQAERAAQGTQA